MQFYDVINNRKSIKRFKNTHIEEDKLNRMINATMASPTWKNRSSFRFVLVEDDSVKNQLSNCVLNETNEAAKSIREAPMVAVVVSNPESSGEVDDKEMYLVDSAIAMEHFILAASNEGYGTCWIAALDEMEVKKTLKIPNEFKVVALTPVGEASEVKDHYPMKDVGEHFYRNQFNNSYRLN